MKDLKIIKHTDLVDVDLVEICKIKSIAWPYPLESQKKWIENNILPNDLHFLLYDEHNEVVAYLNLVCVEVYINNRVINVFGIGNVCAKFQGKGLGQLIMKQVSDYLLDNNFIGLLFCSAALTSFYKKFGWEIIEHFEIDKSLNLPTGAYMMSFNVPYEIVSVKYADRLF